MSSPNVPKYGAASVAINRKIKNGEAGNLNSNQAVRGFARSEYEAMGKSRASVDRHMDRKDAGHRVARNNGGKNTASNYMWEDRHDNRAHGDTRIRASQERAAGRR
jgi:hypothetical protein